ncbi:ATP-binding cassette domain-containing protein [Mesorhizobium sp. CA18]|uniref:ATP-binding cassette domain-containing protein n=1 Tax=unclassified Mesorhizobium TaxID=325217 RepID=UPI001CCD995F|nr:MULTISPECIES: ATP-binding cassette domain-containing protein [unclassified Mesorhizobium]MBZ9734326.1 ATP-binding cassette domain-containing protein [Mesorhizobium sp. CA9]MBZ9824607.1 ATP-binding cassette domain-containing protein [Mesorhizobium sp. CA18]MBZ9877975.1 ATP-binding cassette domain-containing protein [Mesorhizobium sp. Ca11]MBZ9900780.1 ATP-binding cassette domain-containing protein [Mesorhizobium sp. CA17]
MALIGHSGSGKATCLRCLRSRAPGNPSRWRTDRRQPRPADERSPFAPQRAEMGMVFQLSNLWPHLSVTENVAIAVRKVRGLPAREAKELALEMPAKVHMTHRVHDEPTSALDPELGA